MHFYFYYTVTLVLFHDLSLVSPRAQQAFTQKLDALKQRTFIPTAKDEDVIHYLVVNDQLKQQEALVEAFRFFKKRRQRDL